MFVRKLMKINLIVNVAILAPLLLMMILPASISLAQGQGNGNNNGGGNGGGGQGKTAPYTLVDLEGFPVAYPGGRTHFQSYALSLNEPDGAGGVQVVGYAYSEVWPVGLKSPTLWDVNADGSFTITDLGLLPLETGAWATDVNDLGVITISTAGSEELTPTGHPILPAWVLPAPGQTRLRLAIQGTQAEALAINNLGDIAGSDHNPSPSGVAWQLADPATEINLGLFAPSDIDESGVMAGLVGTDAAAPAIAWFDSMNKLQVQELEFLSPTGNATAISQDGQMFDLHSLADTGRKIQLLEAAEINNAGHIVGYMKVSVKGHNEEQAFVLIPNPQ